MGTLSKIISVLHLSDLHRSNISPVSNNALINSLESDYQRYTKNELIPKPDLIVVSGDIVMGITGDTPDDLALLKRQYDEALEFLSELASLFFEGDKSRIILVPGNHDVNRYSSKQSMTPIIHDGSEEQQLRAKRELSKIFRNSGSQIRWSWSSFQFYKISNLDLYDQRFGEYSDFYKAFYDGTRNYSLKSPKQYEIFDFPELDVTIVGFNSCFGNDHCNNMGKIHPDCLADVSRILRKTEFRNRLVMAVWHHNTSGGPIDNDYMDGRILQNFIDSNFSIGLHGHQHKAEFLYQQFNIDATRKIVVLSSGSLCASPEELPGGESREYNIYEIDRGNRKITIHVRKAMETTSDCPIWSTKIIGSKGGASQQVDFTIPNNEVPLMKESKNVGVKELSEVIDLMAIYDFGGASERLESMDFNDDYVRSLLLECYVEIDNPTKIVKRYDPPKGNRETIIVMESLWELKEKEILKGLLNQENIIWSDDPSIQEAYRKYVGRVN